VTGKRGDRALKKKAKIGVQTESARKDGEERGGGGGGGGGGGDRAGDIATV